MGATRICRLGFAAAAALSAAACVGRRLGLLTVEEALVRSGCLTAAALLGLSGIAEAASPLYLTTFKPLPVVGYTSDDVYTFIAPYFVHVKTKISVSITKAASPAGPAAANPKLAAPTEPSPVRITKSEWEDTKVTFTVNCDLTSTLAAKNTIDVVGVDSAVNGRRTVTTVAASTIEATLPTSVPKGNSSVIGAITSVNCPSDASNNTLTVTITVIPIPQSPRGYLYLRKDAFYSDSVNVSVGSDGLLSSSDSSSAQQITAILTELAQTATAAVGGVGPFALRGGAEQQDRQKCFQALNDLVKYGPYYKQFEISSDALYRRLNDDGPGPAITLQVKPLVSILPSEPEEIDFQVAPGILGHPGLMAFFPVPAEAEIVCKTPKTYFLSEPTKVNLYTEKHYLNPERDFLTGPQDTFTFSSGFIVGHKYSDQSPAKTIVDTVTSPIRAMIPSVSVTQSTTLQSSGASSKTTSTTTSAPKGQ
jgi:hypothetical protein